MFANAILPVDTVTSEVKGEEVACSPEPVTVPDTVFSVVTDPAGLLGLVKVLGDGPAIEVVDEDSSELFATTLDTV